MKGAQNDSDDKQFVQFSEDDKNSSSKSSVEGEEEETKDELKDDVTAINKEITSQGRKISGKLQRGFTVD